MSTAQTHYGMSDGTRPGVDGAHFKIVESYARFFARPEVRLRFLNSTLTLQSQRSSSLQETLDRRPFLRRLGLDERLLNLSLYALIFREVGRLLPSDSGARRGLLGLHKEAPFSAKVLYRCYQFRRALYALAAVAAVALCFFAYRGAAWSARRANEYLTGRYRVVERVYAGEKSPVAPGLAERLPSYQPEKVWMVERGDGFERYSNGARIITTFEATNRPRRYLTFNAGEARPSGAAQSAPAGIVYHTSESDLVPFVEDNSGSIEYRSKNLLAYVRDHKSYNYVIDRFGQIYRVVKDEDTAYHAGNSVWSDTRGVFVGLNESFLGVCFETKADAGEGEQLTEAQLLAGRLLTQVLRSRYHIDDADCVTHGLVSVNPDNMRILFHHDWARNFPFEALGLSDKYAVAPASVAELGFGYDADIVAQIGGSVWPGVGVAEGEFARRAGAQGTSPDELRRRMRSVYRERMDAQRALARDEGQEAHAGSGEAGPDS